MRTVSDGSFHYREIDPPPALAGVVRCIWRLRGPATAAAPPEPILPDGCVEIVLNVGDPFARHVGTAAAYRQPRRLLTGQLTTAIAIAPTGNVDLWGIRFEPWAAAAFLRVSGEEIRDRMLTIDDASPMLDRELARVFDAPPAERVDLITEGLTRQVRLARPRDTVLPSLVSRIVTRGEVLSVRELARDVGLGTRRLQAIFAEQVGMSPKMLMRIARLQRALRIARERPSLSWGAVAIEAGYYDQPHLNRDCRAIAGCSPSALIARDAGLTETFLDSGDRHPDA
jgi:AraC-like DNA-binding protein